MCGLPTTPAERTTSRVAATANFGAVRPVESCTPTAVGTPSAPVEKRMRSVKVDTATVRFGRRVTSGVRYAVAEELPRESYVDWFVFLEECALLIRTFVVGVHSGQERSGAHSPFVGVEVTEKFDA